MNKQEYQNINIDQLVPFKDHPFKLYEEQRFKDMVESIGKNGVLVPIVVRPVDNGQYEILSGHNRVAAAKEAGLREIPAVVRDVDEEKARIIVTLTNLQQRGFGELTHSERAEVIKFTYTSLKRQGQRTDLINEVDILLDGKEPISDILKKLPPKEAVAKQFGLTVNNIAYYLRLDKLIKQLLNLLDEGEFDLSVAEKLTYLSEKNQTTIYKILIKENIKITIGKAKVLVKTAKKELLTEQAVMDILAYHQSRKSNHRLNADVFEKYFANTKPEAVDDIIAKALAMWEQAQV
jgi:ParB family chromosome partitioning protein